MNRAPGRDSLVQVEGRRLKLTNLDKVFYPEAGWTKAHVLDYYRRAAPVLLPHLKDRPVTLKRYPDGVEGSFFYEKECPAHAPEWVKHAPVWSETRGADINFCVLDDLPSLLWAANLADLEIHTYLARKGSPQRPDFLVFDLDPGAPADVQDCAEVALWIRDVFDSFGLRSFAKTSGSKGLQMYVPLNVDVTFDDTKPFARAVGELVERDHPDRVTTNMSKAERPGKVLIDWSQNDGHKTTVCAYSLRAKAEPTVSTPVEWREVEAAVRRGDAASSLRFRAEDALRRVEEKGDLFAPVLSMEQALPALG